MDPHISLSLKVKFNLFCTTITLKLCFTVNVSFLRAFLRAFPGSLTRVLATLHSLLLFLPRFPAFPSNVLSVFRLSAVVT